jgi:hypothetical protein
MSYCCSEKIDRLEKKIRKLEAMITKIDLDDDHVTDRYVLSKILRSTKRDSINMKCSDESFFDSVNLRISYKNKMLHSMHISLSRNNFCYIETPPYIELCDNRISFINDDHTAIIELNIEYSCHPLEKWYEYPDDSDISEIDDEQCKELVFDFKDIKGRYITRKDDKWNVIHSFKWNGY